MKIHCPHCDQRIEVGPEHSGIVAACPNPDCGQEFMVPVVTSEAAPQRRPPPPPRPAGPKTDPPVLKMTSRTQSAGGTNDRFEGFEVQHDNGEITRHTSTKTIEEELLNGSMRRQNLVRFVTSRSTINIPDELQNWNPIGRTLVNQNYPGIYKLYDSLSAYEKAYSLIAFLVFFLGGAIGVLVFYSVFLDQTEPGTLPFLRMMAFMKFVIIPVMGFICGCFGKVIGGSIGWAVGNAKLKTMPRPPEDGFLNHRARGR